MTFKKLCLSLIVFCVALTGFSLQAQEDNALSEKEMEQFAEVFIDIQAISEDAREGMVAALDEVGMSVDRFNEIQQMAQDPSSDLALSDEEEEQLNQANQSIQGIQMDAQQKMQQAILDNGMSVEKYQEIAMQVQTNPDLQQKIQAIMMGSDDE